MANIAFRACVQAYDASFSVSSLNIAAPTGTQSNDGEEMWVTIAALAPANPPLPSTPANWTSRGSSTTSLLGAGAINVRTTLFTRTRGTTVQTESVSTAGGVNALIAITRKSFSNTNAAEYFGQVNWGAQTSAGTSLVVPSQTTTRANSLVSYYIAQTTAQSVTPPGTLTERVDNASTGASSHDAIQVTAGAVGTRTFTLPSSAQAQYGYAEYYSDNAFSLVAATGSFTLAGQAAGLKVAHRLVADAGAFTLTGQAASIGKSYPLVAAAAAFVLTGQAATLRATRRLTAASGSFTLTGVAARLKVAYRLAAGTGSFVVAGQAAGLYRGYTLVAAAGAFTLTGEAAGLLHARVLAAATGTFSLTGQAATFRRALRLAAGTGAFTLTGQDAGLNVAGNIVLAAEAGAFTLTGQAAGLRAARRLSAAPGSFSFTGRAASMRVARLLTADAGVFVLEGQAAGLRVTRRLVGDAGSFALTGQDAALLLRRRLSADTGMFELVGREADFGFVGGDLRAQTGVFLVTGHAVRLVVVLATLPGRIGGIRRPVLGGARPMQLGEHRPPQRI